MNRPLLLSALFLLPSLGMAQDAFDYHCSDITILQAKPVQKDMGITEAQRTKMNAAAQRHQQTLNALDKEYKGKPMNPTEMKKVKPELATAFFKLKKEVCAVLSPAQLKRLRELNLQRIGVAALNDDVVAKKIGMSEAQIKQYRAAFIAGGQQAAKIQQDAAKPILEKFGKIKPKDKAEADTLRTRAREEVDTAERKVAPQVTAIEKSTQAKLEAIITPKQKAAFKALMGKPFKPAS